MKKILYLIIITCFAIKVTGQGTDKVLVRWGEIQLINDPEKSNNIKDQYFLNGQWSTGELLTTNDGKIKVDRVRLNLTSKKFEVQKGEEIFLADNRIVNKITLNHLGKEYLIVNKYVPELDKNNTSNLIVLVDSPRYKLYKAIKLIKKSPNYNPVLKSGNKEGSIVQKEVFIFESEKGVINIIPGKKKKAKKLLSKIEAFKSKIKKNSYNLTKEDDLVSLFSL